jgi:hypothetical protein
MRELLFFFHRSTDSGFQRCAAPDLNHGGKLGTNPFLSFVPFSFFFFFGGSQEIRILVGDFICSGLIPPLYPHFLGQLEW